MAVEAQVTAAPRPASALQASVTSSVIGKIAEMATLLGLATVVPRALGPAEYGRFSVALTIVTIGSLALVLGGPTTLARFVPAAPREDRVALARRLGARLAIGRAAQIGVVAVVATIAVAADPDRFPPLVTLAVVLALALNVVATLGLQVGLGLGRAGPWSARYPMQNAVLIVAVIALDAVGGTTGAALALVVAGAAAAMLGVAVVRPVLAAPGRDVALPTGAIRFGQLYSAGAALTQVAHRGGVIAVAILAGSGEEAGYTSLALGIALGVTYAVLQAFTVSLPHLVDGSDRQTATAEHTLRRLCWMANAVLIPCSAVGALALGWLVPVVLGSDYDGAITTFGPAIALVTLAPLNALAVQAAALRLRPGASLAAGVAAVVVFAVTALATIPAWGAPGGTTAALAAVAASAITSMVLLPGAITPRLAATSFLGAGLVLALAVQA